MTARDRYDQAMRVWCAARYRLEMGRGDFDEECEAKERMNEARDIWLSARNNGEDE